MAAKKSVTKSKVKKTKKPVSVKKKPAKQKKSAKKPASKQPKPKMAVKKAIKSKPKAKTAASPKKAKTPPTPSPVARSKSKNGTKVLSKNFLQDLAQSIREAVHPLITNLKGREIVGTAQSGDATNKKAKINFFITYPLGCESNNTII